MTAEKSDKKGNGLQIFLVVLVLVSMVLNVYLFRYYAEQDDGVEVMTTWADANREIHQELTSITKTLADLEARQGAQDESIQSVLETLTIVETRQAEEAARPAVEPNWLDKDSWADANAQMQDFMASITKTLADLEARQGAQDESIQSVLETLTLVETRQAEEAAKPAVEPNWLDRDSWADANAQTQDSLASITKTLAVLEARQGAQDKSLQSVIETLTLVETRQAEEAATPAVEPNWLDRDSWAGASEKMQDTLVSITKTLADLEVRQGAQDKSLQSVIETLTLVETRQAEEAATPAVEPNWLDRDSWADANEKMQDTLVSITKTLADLEARQGAQDKSLQSVIETLTLVETRQAEEAAMPAVEPNWLDRDSWADANAQMQDSLASITKTLADLEARQGAQDKSLQSVIETLTLVETRQAEEGATPAAEPNWLDRESWATANQQIGEELAAIKVMLDEIKVEVQEAKEAVERNEDAQVEGSASLLELETEPDRTIQVMAPLAEATYQENLIEAEEHTCPIVEVRLLPGDSVWGIVARFRPSPRPTLVNAVVEYNEITDPRRLPVGFPVKVPMDLVNGK